MMKNLWSVFIGLIIFFILVEVSFRIYGLFLKPDLKISKDVFKIVCIGDSSTYGLGASKPSYAYPAQLQKLLETNNKVQVINLGLPGINSSQGLELFSKNISRIFPQVIIVCIGINDPWNLEQSNIIRFYESKGLTKFNLYLKYYILNLKFIRFLKLILISSEDKKSNKDFPIPSFSRDTIFKNNKLMPVQAEQNNALRKNYAYNFKEYVKLAEKYDSKIYFLEYHAPGWQNPQTIIHEIYNELNLNVIKIYDFFERMDNSNNDIRSADGWHLNDKGYEILAKIICNNLKDKIALNCPFFILKMEPDTKNEQ